MCNLKLCDNLIWAREAGERRVPKRKEALPPWAERLGNEEFPKEALLRGAGTPGNEEFSHEALPRGAGRPGNEEFQERSVGVSPKGAKMMGPRHAKR